MECPDGTRIYSRVYFIPFFAHTNKKDKILTSVTPVLFTSPRFSVSEPSVSTLDFRLTVIIPTICVIYSIKYLSRILSEPILFRELSLIDKIILK